MTRLPKIRLGQSDLYVCPLAMGCWAWGDKGYWLYDESRDGSGVVDAFDGACGAGIDLFDTAEAYGWGRSERIVGALARRGKYPIRVATKYAPLSGRGGPRAIRKGLEGSLRRLGLSRIDLYQLHWADLVEVPIAATMGALAELVHEGKVGCVGVSNFSASEMREAHAALARHGVALASNQVRYSLLHRNPEVNGVLATCEELGVTLLAYSPLEQGILSGRYTPTTLPPPPRGESPWFERQNLEAALGVVTRMQDMAVKRGVDVSAIALAWLLDRGVVAIAGARNGHQARANARSLEIRLDEAEREELDRISNHWRGEDSRRG